MSSSWLATDVLWQVAGWTMLHFLWIGGLFALFAALVQRQVQRCSLEIRYSVAVTQFFMLALIPCGLFAWKMNNSREGPDSPVAVYPEAAQIAVNSVISSPSGGEDLPESVAIDPIDADVAKISDEFTASPDDSSSSTSRLAADNELVGISHSHSTTQLILDVTLGATNWLISVLPWVWLVGFPLACCTLLMGISGAEHLRRRCRILDESHPAVVLCRRLQSTLNLRKRVLIGMTDSISTPILVGIIRPLILFPASTLAGISAEQLEMILLHELAHVRRWDNLINLMQRVIESILFFHPAVWWLSNRVRLEREHCCDFAVLAHAGSPQNYAEMLVQMALSNSPPDWVMGTSISHQLIPRIRKILKQEEDRMQVSRKMIVASLSVLLSLAIATIVNAQRDPIKPEGKQPAAAAENGPATSSEEVEPKSDETRRRRNEPQEPLDPKQRANVISITGTVLKEDGQPARWSEVWLAGDTRLPGSRYGTVQLAFVRADIHGKFELWHPCWRGNDWQPGEHSSLWVFARTRDGALTPFTLLNLTTEYRDKKEIHGLELKAVPMASYSGRVVDADGKPIPNAKISPKYLIRPATANNRPATIPLTPELTAKFSTLTDAAGKFTLVDLPESKMIMAKLAGAKFVERDVRWGTELEPELRVEAGGAIRGTISNLPYKDFCEEVDLFIRSARGGAVDQPQPQFSFIGQFSPQPDGTFEFQDLPPGRYELNIIPKRADLTVPQQFYIPVTCECTSGHLTDHVDLKLSDVIVGHGRVVDDQSGAPIEGAAIHFLKQHDQFRQPIGSTTTDANGEYRAYFLPGRIVVEPGRAPNAYLTPLEHPQGQAIDYAKDFEIPTLKYQRAITFRGSVVDEAGRPVPAAEIRWFQPPRKGQMLPTPVTSDEDGRFEISQVDPENVLPLRVRSPQGVSTAVVLPTTELVQPNPIVVSPKNAFRLKGTLTNQRGKPISNATVGVHWHRQYIGKIIGMGTSSQIEKVKTNDQGQFESSAFWDTDRYHVVIEAKGFPKTDLAHVIGSVGHAHDYGNVQLKGTNLSVSGKVVGTDGQPIADARVFNSGDAVDVVSTSTGENGQFQLDGMLDGPVYIFAEHSKYRLAGAYVADPSKGVVLTLIPLTTPSVPRAALNDRALDEARQHQADQLAEWIKAKNLNFRPNLRDSRFNALARTNPDEALAQIEKQSKAMDERSARIIARSLVPDQPRRRPLDGKEQQAIKTALRFVDRSASRIGDQDANRQIYQKADSGLLYLQLGDAERGKALIEAAAKDLSESKSANVNLGKNIAKGLAWYDIPRALKYRETVKEENHVVTVRNCIILEVARYNVPRALELLKDPSLHSPRDYENDRLKLDLACRIGKVEPQIAADLIARIINPRTKAEAAGWTAVEVAAENPELAQALIDQGLDGLRVNRVAGQNSFYYEYVPAVAANLALQAGQIQHPELESIIQKVLALRIPAHKGTSSISRYQSTVNVALHLAFVDPPVARRLLADLEHELTGQQFGNGGSESVGMRRWLCAWVIADPEHAVELLKAEIEKLRGDEKPPHWIDSAYTLLWLPRSEQLDFVRHYGDTGLTYPFMD